MNLLFSEYEDKVLHLVNRLEDKDKDMQLRLGRRIIVGDLHGDWKGLVGLINRVNPTKEDVIILDGDICDHFKSKDRNVKHLVQLILDIRSTYNIQVVKGNHDEMFSNWLTKGGYPPSIWWNQGGIETLRDYDLDLGIGYPDDIPESHRNFFLKEMTRYYLDDVVLAVHGGVNNSIIRGISSNRLSHDDWQESMWLREMTLPEDWVDFMGSRLLVVGHTQRVKVDGVEYSSPYVVPGIVCVDSHNSLWAVVVEDDGSWKLVESPTPSDKNEAYPYYPGIRDHEIPQRKDLDT